MVDNTVIKLCLADSGGRKIVTCSPNCFNISISHTFLFLVSCSVRVDDKLYHQFTRTDLYYTRGVSDKAKESDPIEILRRHAVHLFLGGFDDVTKSIKVSDFHVSLYHWDSHGNKILLTRTFLYNSRYTLARAMMAAKDKEDGTLWLEAKVVPKQQVTAAEAIETKPKDITDMTLPNYIDWVTQDSPFESNEVVSSKVMNSGDTTAEPSSDMKRDPWIFEDGDY